MADNRNNRKRTNVDGNDRVVVNPEQRRLYEDTTPVRRTAWGAVIAGALVALMTTLVLSLLFSGIGLQSINPATEQNPLAGLGTGGIIAVIATNLIALFLGGWVAGKLAGSPRNSDALLHGVLTWGVLTLATVFLLNSAVGRLVGGVTSLVGNTASTVATAAGSAAQGAAAATPDSAQGVESAINQIPGISNVQQQVDQFLADAGVQDPAEASQQLVRTIVNRVQAGESLTSPEAQQEISDVIANNSDLSEQEIEQQVQTFTQDVEQTAQQVVQETEQVAEDAAGVAGTSFIWAAVGLLLGAIVAALGAMTGSPKDEVEARAG